MSVFTGSDSDTEKVRAAMLNSPILCLHKHPTVSTATLSGETCTYSC